MIQQYTFHKFTKSLLRFFKFTLPSYCVLSTMCYYRFYMAAMEILFQFTNKNSEPNYSQLHVKISFSRWLQPHGMAQYMLAITPHHQPLASTKPCQPWSLAKTVNISNTLTQVLQFETWRAGERQGHFAETDVKLIHKQRYLNIKKLNEIRKTCK